jgi:hypothetical protein
MLNRRNTLIAAASTLAVTGAITLSGLTAASAAPARPAAATAARTATATVHFQEMTTANSPRHSTVIATGGFTAGGTDTVTGNLTDTFNFPGGTFKITHSKGHGSQSFDPHSCLFQLRQRGTYTLSNGTGQFAGISGHGRYLVTVLGVSKKANGKCARQPIAIEQEIQAHGPAHL